MKPYYTLFVFNKDTKKYEDVFGSYSRAEVVEEGQEYFGQRKRILKNDGTHVGLMKNYAELGQRVQDLHPSDEDLVIFNAVQFPRRDEGHIYYIIGNFKGQWVTAMFNNDSKGFYCDHYFGTCRTEAEADFRANVGAEFDTWTRGKGLPKFDSLEEAYAAAIERRDSILVNEVAA